MWTSLDVDKTWTGFQVGCKTGRDVVWILGGVLGLEREERP